MKGINDHSHQRQYQCPALGADAGPGATRCLADFSTGTQTVESVIRILIGEIERDNRKDDDVERDIVGNENKQYKRR